MPMESERTYQQEYKGLAEEVVEGEWSLLGGGCFCGKPSC